MLSVTILRCRRCERMIKKDEVLIVNWDERHETWRCPYDNGVCDAVELTKATKGRKRKEGKLRQRKEDLPPPFEFINQQRYIK
jgi:hypothetical protein